MLTLSLAISYLIVARGTRGVALAIVVAGLPLAFFVGLDNAAVFLGGVGIVAAVTPVPVGFPRGILVGSIDFGIADLIVVGVALYFVTRRSDRRLRWPAAVCFAGLVLFSAVFGERYPGASAATVVRELQGPILLLCTAALVALVSDGQARALAKACVGALVVSGSLIAFSFVTGYEITGMRSATVTFGQSADLGVSRYQTPATAAALAALAAAIGFFLAGGRTSRRAMAVVVVPAALITALALSRNSLLGIASAVLVTFVVVGRFRTVVRLCASLTALVALVVGLSWLHLIPSAVSEAADAYRVRVVGGLTGSALENDLSIQYREDEIERAVAAWKHHPFIGQGLGTPYKSPTGPTTGFFAVEGPFYVHNGYLFILLKMGAVGLAAFLMTTGFEAWRLYRRRGSVSVPIPAVAAAIAALTALLVINLVSPMTWGADAGVPLGVCLGVVVRFARSPKRAAAESEPQKVLAEAV